MYGVRCNMDGLKFLLECAGGRMYRTGIAMDGHVMIMSAWIWCSVPTVPFPFAATMSKEQYMIVILPLLERYMKHFQSFIPKWVGYCVADSACS